MPGLAPSAFLPRVTTDALGRPLGSLRLSLTDRCNLRCRYCMPEEEYVWLPRSSILTFEEIARLVGAFTSLGVAKIRLTGGEPLLRHDVPGLVSLLAENPGVRDLAITTNGMLLAQFADSLRLAGLHRVTVSLDTLRPDRFEAYTRSRRHADVLAGIAAARDAGFQEGGLKLNTVVVRGYNEDELPDLIEYGRAVHAEVRFIEYMDVGGATQWTPEQVVSRAEILQRLGARYGDTEPLPTGGRASAPAERFRLADGTTFGIIASTTAPFCANCDRSRITADGTWYLCLYAERGISLRDLLRGGASDAEIAERIVSVWRVRDDRGAERRLELIQRGILYPVDALRRDPRREMHTRGG